MTRRPPRPTRTDTLFPYTTLFRSPGHEIGADLPAEAGDGIVQDRVERLGPDRHAPVDAGRIALQPSGRRRLQDGLGHVPVLSPRVVARPRPPLSGLARHCREGGSQMTFSSVATLYAKGKAQG